MAKKIAGHRTALGRGLITGKPNVGTDRPTNVRYRESSGRHVDIAECPLLTQSRHPAACPVSDLDVVPFLARRPFGTAKKSDEFKQSHLSFLCGTATFHGPAPVLTFVSPAYGIISKFK